VPCVLGAKGVERVVELELDDAGRKNLQASAAAIRTDLDTLRAKGLL